MDQKKETPPPPVERVKSNLLEIIRLTRDTISFVKGKGYKIDMDPNLCNIAVKILEGVQSNKIVDGFIERSFNYWDRLKNKDEEFLLVNATVLFGELDLSVTNTFAGMMRAKDENGKSYVQDETKESVWKLIHAMIKGSIKYVHESRCPKEIDGKMKYTNEFFPKIRISEQVQIWNIKI